MTFNDYWRENGIKSSGNITPILEKAFKEIALSAWNAALDSAKSKAYTPSGSDWGKTKVVLVRDIDEIIAR